MKKLLISMMAMLLPLAASAYDVCIDGIYYNVVKKAKQATVTYGDNESGTYSGDIVIPNTIVYDGVICNVEVIGEKAFNRCENLTSIFIPRSLKKINHPTSGDISDDTFFRCPNNLIWNIEDIASWCNVEGAGRYMGNGSEYDARYFRLFVNGEEANDLVIPEGVTIVNGGTFTGFNNITSVTIANSTKTIGKYAFAFCPNLQTLDLGIGVTTIGVLSFQGCSALKELRIPDSVEEIEAEAFQWCSFDVVYFGRGLKKIGMYFPYSKKAFVPDISLWCSIDFDSESSPLSGTEELYINNEKINELIIPEGITKVPRNAFAGCYAFTSIIIPNSVTEIGGFSGCINLESITFGDGVRNVYGSAFKDCTGLKRVNAPSIESWCNIRFGNWDNTSNPLTYAHHLFINGQEITNLIIPDGIKAIGYYQFNYLTSLTSVTIPKTVNSLADNCFANCTELTDIYCLPVFPPESSSQFSYGEGTYGDQGGYPTYPFTGSMIEYATLHVPNITIDKYQAKHYCEGFGSIVSLKNGDPGFIQPTGEAIEFVDKNVELLCLANWDLNGDYQLTKIEAAAVNDIGSVFRANKEITSFDEFQFFTGLTNKSITTDHFIYCENLESLVLPEGIETIELGAFSYGFDSLKKIALPESLKTIGYQAFNSWTGKLLDIYCASLNPPSISYGSFNSNFYYSATLTLHVPFISLEAYKNTENWNKFANITILEEGDPYYKLMLVAKNYTRVYGEPNPEFEYDINSTSETGTPVITCSATKTSPIGTYDIVLNKGTINSDDVVLVNGTLTITKAPLTISVGEYTRLIGEENPSFTPTFTGFKNDENESVLTIQPTISCSATIDSPVGNYPITVSGAEAQNYEINYENGMLTITKEVEVGDTFIALTQEDIPVTYQIVSIVDKTCVVSSGESNVSAIYNKTPGIITIPSEVNGYNVIGLGDFAFSNCYNLTTINLPNSIKTIGEFAFLNCQSLPALTIPDSVTSIGHNAFKLCINISTLDLPNSVITMGTKTFAECSKLTSISFGNSITIMGNTAFENCTKLEEIIMPNSVTTIGYGTFRGCTSLKKVTIGSSVKSIPGAVFSNCTALTDVYCLPTSVPKALTNTFENVTLSSVVLHVPSVSIDLYSAANIWKDFKNIVALQNGDPGTIVQGIDINDINFPDAVFREYVSNTIDINQDGKLSEEEIAGVTTIYAESKGITNLKGIEYFTAVTYLSCGDNQLTSLDVSKNTALKYLYCHSNQLTSLDVSKNTALTKFSCGGNQLTSLDVSKNTALTDFNCQANQLTSLDATNNTALTRLFCNNNKLTSLDVSKNTALIHLDCHNNQLTSLDVSKNNTLTILFCDDNQLTLLDVSKNTLLTDLSCYNNQLTSLDLSKNTTLTILFCAFNQLTSLDVSKNTALTHLGCNNNLLTSLDLSKNTELTRLYCYNNKLTSLDLSNNTLLTYLGCYQNKIGETAMGNLVASLPTSTNGEFYVIDTAQGNEQNVITKSQVTAAKAKGWTVYDFHNGSSVEYAGSAEQTPGDLNDDGIINGVDLVAQTNLILTDQYNATADLNNDGVVNGLDYVIMVNLILSETSAPAMQAAGSNRVAATSSLSIENFDIKAGETKELFINLSNPNTDLTLLQFDMRLPEGLSIATEDGDYAIDIAGRTTWKKHSLMAKATNGITRFLLTSNTNAIIDGDDGNVISIKLTASDSFTSGDICLENQLLVSPDAEDVMPADFIYSVGGTTSIDAMGSKVMQLEGVYDLQGRRVKAEANSSLFTLHSSLKKGVYIVNGKKIIVK